MRGDYIGNARIADLCLGAHDALREGGRGREKRVRDLFRGESAHFAQGEGDLRVRCQGRMTAGEDQAEAIVLDAIALLQLRRVVRGCVESPGELSDRRVEPRPPAHGIDRLEATSRYQPRARAPRDTVAWPALHRRRERVMQRLLGSVNSADPADQRGEAAGRVRAVDGVHQVPYLLGHVLAHRQGTPTDARTL